MLSKFKSKKHHILGQLHKPDTEYQDLSPKGSVDSEIRELVQQLNDLPGFVTTSSCAGRVAVYLEGAGKASTNSVPGEASFADAGNSATVSKGGKGGGRWLFNSHTPVRLDEFSEAGSIYAKLGFVGTTEISFPSPDAAVRFVHLKFEPMILHILSQSAEHAQSLLSVAMASGFRESGISGVVDNKGHHATPMLAVRSSGLSVDCIIGFQAAVDDNVPGTQQIQPMVSEDYLRTLLQVANERFRQNIERKERFRMGVISEFAGSIAPGDDHRSDYRRRGGFQTAAGLKAQKRAEDMKKRDAALRRRAEKLQVGGALDGTSGAVEGAPEQVEDGNEAAYLGLDMLTQSDDDAE